MIGYAALAYGGTQMLSGSSGGSGKKKKETPAGSVGGPPGIGGYPGMGPSGPAAGSAGAGPQILFEAPKVPAPDQSAPASVQNLPYSGGGGGGGAKSGKKSDKKAGNKNKGQSTTSKDTQTSTDVEVTGSGSKDPEPEPKTDTEKLDQALEDPGVQSEDPDLATQELNIEQGFTRSQSSAETGLTGPNSEAAGPDDPLGLTHSPGDGKKSGKKKNGGDSGFIPDNIPIFGGF